MGVEPLASPLAAILASLGQEICDPLDRLRAGVSQILDSASNSAKPAPTEAELVQARTILTLCEDLDRLTRECLGMTGPPD